jgi:hypothetical protein
VVHILFCLASGLLRRFNVYRQPEDIKSSVKYFRFLRINFHPLEAFDIPHGLFTSQLLRALAHNFALGSGDVIQGMEEMVAVIPEVLASDVSTSDTEAAIVDFTFAVIGTEVFRGKDTQHLVERVIQMLREATVLQPDSHDASFALLRCLAHRFAATHVINDYEEAMAIADNIVATHSPGDSLTLRQRNAITLISILLVSRLNSYSRPDYLENTIHRFRTLLSLPSLPDQLRTNLTVALDGCAQRRFRSFGVTGNSGGTPHDSSDVAHISLVWKKSDVSQEDDPALRMLEKRRHLENIHSRIKKDATTDVEAAVELSRTLRPLPQSCDQWSYLPAIEFADILYDAHFCTKRLDYLNEAITAYRDIRKMSAPKAIHFQAGTQLLWSLIARFNLLHVLGDFYLEGMQLFLELTNDGSGEVFIRFKISSSWARSAQLFAHTSTSAAYDITKKAKLLEGIW